MTGEHEALEGLTGLRLRLRTRNADVAGHVAAQAFEFTRRQLRTTQDIGDDAQCIGAALGEHVERNAELRFATAYAKAATHAGHIAV